MVFILLSQRRCASLLLETKRALGAQPHHVIRAIGTRIVLLIAAGVCFGLLGSLGFTAVTGTLVFGVSTGDAATFVSMTALLVVISMLAFVIPVRAATRLDAVAAIRHE